MEPINFTLILGYGVRMTLILAVGIGFWTLKVKMSPVDTRAWYRTNGQSILISLGLCWLISAALVIVPDFATVLGGLGFNADASPAGLTLVIIGFLIGGAVDPPHPSGSQ